MARLRCGLVCAGGARTMPEAFVVGGGEPPTTKEAVSKRGLALVGPVGDHGRTRVRKGRTMSGKMIGDETRGAGRSFDVSFIARFGSGTRALAISVSVTSIRGPSADRLFSLFSSATHCRRNRQPRCNHAVGRAVGISRELCRPGVARVSPRVDYGCRARRIATRPLRYTAVGRRCASAPRPDAKGRSGRRGPRDFRIVRGGGGLRL